MITYTDIKTVDLEISTLCNASCPDCPRNLRGYELEDPGYVLHSLTLDEVKTLLPVEFIKQLNQFKIIGNHGDFITCKDGLKIVQYLHAINPTMAIYISTNASGQPNIWTELGSIPTLRIGFRIDGLKDTHSIYRQNTDFDLIISNAIKFIKAGGAADWEMIQFDFNQHQIDQAREKASELGFRRFILHDQGRNKMPVFDRQGNFVRNIGSPEHHNEISDLLRYRKNIVDNHVSYHEIQKNNVDVKPIECVAKKNKSIYIQVNGQVYPCCWTGFFPDINVERTGNDQIKTLSQGNNAFDVGIVAAVGWFFKLEHAWSMPLIEQGRPYICNETCGKINCSQ